MKIVKNGCLIEGRALSSSPNNICCSFTDCDGARIVIDSKLLIQQYELLKFDAERHGYWDELMKKMEEV